MIIITAAIGISFIKPTAHYFRGRRSSSSSDKQTKEIGEREKETLFLVGLEAIALPELP